MYFEKSGSVLCLKPGDAWLAGSVFLYLAYIWEFYIKSFLKTQRMVFNKEINVKMEEVPTQVATYFGKAIRLGDLICD